MNNIKALQNSALIKATVLFQPKCEHKSKPLSRAEQILLALQCSKNKKNDKGKRHSIARVIQTLFYLRKQKDGAMDEHEPILQVNA